MVPGAPGVTVNGNGKTEVWVYPIMAMKVPVPTPRAERYVATGDPVELVRTTAAWRIASGGGSQARIRIVVVDTERNIGYSEAGG